MGDSARHREFSGFVRRNFRQAKSVLVIADGKGKLARRLAERGFEVRVIEASPRFAGNPHPLVTYQRGWFTAETEVREDLIVGMHPDEATSEIILAAEYNQIPFAVVPCCIMGRHAKGVQGFDQWLKRLRSLTDRFVAHHQLKISGRNEVLYCQK